MTPAYWAGVADSDGSLCIGRLHRDRPNCTYNPMFQLTWTANDISKAAMEVLMAQYGGSFARAGGSSVNIATYKNSKPYYKYSLTGKRLLSFLIDIKPYLLLKKEQAENLITILQNQKNYGVSRPRSEHINVLFFDLWVKNKQLNHKNNKPEKIA